MNRVLFDDDWSVLRGELPQPVARNTAKTGTAGLAADLTLAEGDMPHGWMCASYISLVRNMLVRESGQDLVLMSGVPRHWLRRGATIAVRDLPVQFGTLSYTARVDGDSLRLTIDAPKKARALRVILPSRREITLSATTRSATIPLQ